jgi:L-seryl-tRNA(Ser) seleniumtransferase
VTATETAKLRNLSSVDELLGTLTVGRALIADAAIEAAATALRHAVTLEFDLATGCRGEHYDHFRALLRELTSAEDSTFVNNNAVTVLLALKTLAKGREAIVSRGELIEIGDVFLMPEIMGRAAARLVEVGATNRTHAKDYADAIGPKTELILKVHRPNYRIDGFRAEVAPCELVSLIEALRALPILVLGRIENQGLVGDLCCREDEAGFERNLAALRLRGAGNALV